MKRFMAKVRVLPSGHWIWIGALASEGRYGTATFEKRTRPAHAVAWMLFRGPIPDGMTDIDHLCRKTLCVNPEHLDPKTHRDNILVGDSPMARNAAKTHCIYGHPFSGDNVRRRKGGGRDCMTCVRRRARDAQRRYRERLKARAA